MNWMIKDRLNLIKHPPLFLFLFHVLLTVLGGGISYIVITWHVYALTHSLQSSVINAVLFWVPSIAFCPFIGLIVDRYSRKDILISTNLFRALAFIATGLLIQLNDKPYLCYAMTFINGTTFAFAIPAVHALMRQLVEDKDLLLANTTVDIVFETANILGFACAGVLVLYLSAGPGLIVAGSLIGVGVLSLGLIKSKQLIPYKKDVRQGFFEDWKIAWKTLKNNKALLVMSILNISLFVQFMTTPVLVTPFINEILHGNKQLFAILEICLCVGVIIGSLVMPNLSKRFGWKPYLIMSLTICGLSLVLFSLNHSAFVACLLYFILGLCFPSWSLVISQSQLLMPKAQQGRVNALVNTAASSGILITYLLMHTSSHWIGLVQEYWVCAGIAFFALATLLWFKNQISTSSQS